MPCGLTEAGFRILKIVEKQSFLLGQNAKNKGFSEIERALFGAYKNLTRNWPFLKI
jgi:hypothetical protein